MAAAPPCGNFCGTDRQCKEDDCNFDLDALYKLAVSFYREKQDTKAFVLSYKDKLKFVALTKQVRLGPLKKNNMEVGFLDFIGNDRERAWKSLGEMSKELAMSEFIKSLVDACPAFVPFVKAHLSKHSEDFHDESEQYQSKLEHSDDREESSNEASNWDEITFDSKGYNRDTPLSDILLDDSSVQHNLLESEEFSGTEIRNRLQSNGMHDLTNLTDSGMYDSNSNELKSDHLPSNVNSWENKNCIQLNSMDSIQKCNSDQPNQFSIEKELKETFLSQMRPMLEKLVVMQHPDDQQKQKEALIEMEEKQLKQLFDQYHGNHESQTSINSSASSKPIEGQKTTYRDDGAIEDESNHALYNNAVDINDLPVLESPTLWIKSNIKEFKDSLRNDLESVIEVGSGEIVTVRIPTHEGGSSLFWEFATDHYDIGFGVFFEWLVESVEDGRDESVESDEPEDEPNDDYIELGDNKPIGADNTPPQSQKLEAPIEEVVQLNRLESHEVVQCGSHVYPAAGVYLLKFDNSYSLWRSKKVYYRVYYTA